MAVRFQCGACSQPIEIDDEWASRLVACPYCRKTVTAPASSTLTDVQSIPTASPTATVPPPAVPMALDVTLHPPQVPAHANRIALVAFWLACAMLAMFIAAMATGLVSYGSKLQALQVGAQTDLRGQIEAAEAVAKEAERENPGWFLATQGLNTMGLLAGVAGAVCGIIGVCRPRRRTYAVVALAIIGGMLAMGCAGILMFLALGGG